MKNLKTYSHLLPLNKKPSEYEIVCSELLYYLKKGFEVNVPLKAWYEKYQKNTNLQCTNWEGFSDPKELTYTQYISQQRGRETFVDGLFASMDELNYDKKLSLEWVKNLEFYLTPLRYPWHGLQMQACYLGQLAPSGKIAVAFMFQAADEMRRIHRIAYRMKQIQLIHPTFALESKFYWEEKSEWQPLRRLIENLLVTFDWSEAFLLLSLAIKPIFDNLVFTQMRMSSYEQSDPLIGELFFSLHEDCKWHQQWSQELTRFLIADTYSNKQWIENRLDYWVPQVIEAVTPLFKFEQIEKILREYSKKLTDLNLSLSSQIWNKFEN